MKPCLLILPVLTGLLLATVHLLPGPGQLAPSAISLELPSWNGGWMLQNRPATQEEIQILADDTIFRKATCTKPRLGEYSSISGHAIPDRIDLSIVFSGHDLNNSIHRPERCMPSQGHVIGDSTSVIITTPDGRELPARRLLSVQSIPTNESRTEYRHLSCVTYYFFVGHDAITEDHTKRTLIDIWDRLRHGMNQRWAYVSASMWYGDVPWISDVVEIKEADAKLQKFLVDLAEQQIDWSRIDNR